jgi:putative copper resistance protein D
MDQFFLLLRIATSTLFDITNAGAYGLLLAQHWLRPEVLALVSSLRLTVWLRACTLLMCISLIVQLWLLTATMSGSSGFIVVAKLVPQVLFATHPGIIWALQFLLAVILAAAIRLLPDRAPNVRIWTAFSGLVLLSAARAGSGHAVAQGNFTWAEAMQWAHLVGTAIWSGGVLVSGLLIVPRIYYLRLTSTLSGYGLRLSRTSTFALLAVLLSGMFNAYTGLGGSLPPLYQTAWGHILILKSGLVLATIALGGSNRLLLAKQSILNNTSGTARFVQLLRIEAILMLFILCLSGWLANSPPANMNQN